MDLNTKRCPSCVAIISCRETCCEACVTRARSRISVAELARCAALPLPALPAPPQAARSSIAARNARAACDARQFGFPELAHAVELIQRDMRAIGLAKEREEQLVDELAGVNWDHYSRQPHGE